MAQIIQAIERYHAILSKAAHEHPLCGRPSVCVSTIHGGVGINTVPERATIEIDRRLGPDEKPETAYNELVQFVLAHANVGGCSVEHDPPFMDSSGLSDKLNRPFAERVATLVHDCGRRGELVGVPFGTDAAALSAAGIPTVVFGPGSIAQAHTADEFIEIDELQFATEMFHRIATRELP
jgi:acetylornithine deacetylase